MESGIYSDGKNLFVICGGKIVVGSGIMTINDDCEKYAYVNFNESIGSYAIGEDIIDKESIAGDKNVVLLFDNVASVDVVIKALDRVKERLKGKELL